jgi:hypothetical protein
MGLTPGQGLAVLLIVIFLIIFALLALSKWKLAQFVAAVMERQGVYGFRSSQSSSEDSADADLEAQEEEHDKDGSSSSSPRSVSSDSRES